MTKLIRRPAAGLAAAALGLSGAIVAAGAPSVAHADECVAADTVHVLSFNDFHGRVENAATLFTPVEQLRASAGEDHVLLTSNGDSIGGSTFTSAVADDLPTLDVLNAIGLEASATGNHEYDKGFADLAGRVSSAAQFPYLVSNVTRDGQVPAPLQPYETFEKGGATIAVVGAVTAELTSLVSPGGMEGLTIGDPVAAVNAIAAQLKDGDAGNGEADIVIAQIHEGAEGSDPAAAGGGFADMYDGLDATVDVIVNGHTHNPYLWETAKGQPIIQAAVYGEGMVQADLSVSESGQLCGVTTSEVAIPDSADASHARIAEIERIVAAAEAAAKEKGAVVIGQAEAAISTPGAGNSSTRDQESPMSNMVAQMFFDMMSGGDPEFIGVQNPGGTRDSFDAGDITYEEAALVLPFANSLYTTKVSGKQFIEALNQQWQRDADGNVPSRAYLALGLSDNVSYTYDETRPEGERIVNVIIDGKPIVLDKEYTVGSGSFLISGGDNFRAFGEGTGTRDAGLVDLTAWVDWITEQGNLSPDYSKRGVSVRDVPEEIVAGESATFTVGQPGDVNPGTLDMFLDAEGAKVSPQLPNTVLRAYLGDQEIGTADVEGGVAEITVTIPEGAAPGEQYVSFRASESDTVFWLLVNVLAGEQPGDDTPGDDAPGDDTPVQPGPGKPKPEQPGLPSTGV